MERLGLLVRGLLDKDQVVAAVLVQIRRLLCKQPVAVAALVKPVLTLHRLWAAKAATGTHLTELPTQEAAAVALAQQAAPQVLAAALAGP
jgi:hypothetical protein